MNHFLLFPKQCVTCVELCLHGCIKPWTTIECFPLKGLAIASVCLMTLLWNPTNLLWVSIEGTYLILMFSCGQAHFLYVVFVSFDSQCTPTPPLLSCWTPSVLTVWSFPQTTPLEAAHTRVCSLWVRPVEYRQTFSFQLKKKKFFWPTRFQQVPEN